MMPTVLLVPGLGNSGPEHWQTYWEALGPGYVRVQQTDWETPLLSEWVASLDDAVRRAGPAVVLAAHSAGCALVAAWSQLPGRQVKGALLVAPSDTESPYYPPGARGFAPMPLAPIPFATIVVASTDDEFVSLARAEHFAHAWGSRFVSVGNAGHLNAASRLGDWPTGRKLLADLLAAP